MKFLKELQQHWLAALIIIAVTVIAFLIVKYVFRYLQSILKSTQFFSPIRIIGRVLKGLVILGGILSLAYLFANNQQDEMVIENNFNIIVRVGLTGLFTILFASISRAYFTRLIERNGTNNRDTTKYQFFRTAIENIIYFFGFLFIILSFPQFEKYIKPLLGGAGVLAVILGFAAQEAISNIIAGVLIIFSEPFRLGDIIQISENMIGTVWDISLRHTVIKDFDNKLIVVPNSVINKEKIFNFSMGDTRACQRLSFDIDYTSDVDLARKILAEEVEKHPLSIDPRTYQEIQDNEPRVLTRVINITDFAVVVRVWAWAQTYEDSYVMKCDLLDSVKKRFDKEGIEMPYPHSTLVFRKEDLEQLKGN